MINISGMIKALDLNFILKKHRSKFVFCGRFLLLWVLWKSFFFVTWRTPSLLAWYNNFSLKVISLLLDGTFYLMTLLGENMELDSLLRIVKIKGTPGVTVGEPCIGFDVNAIYIGLILSASGKAINKLWFLILGVMMLVLLNVMRIAALAYLVEINPWLWEVNHKFVFSVVIYFFLFVLWHFWLKFFSIKYVEYNRS